MFYSSSGIRGINYGSKVSIGAATEVVAVTAVLVVAIPPAIALALAVVVVAAAVEVPSRSQVLAEEVEAVNSSLVELKPIFRV